MFAMKAAKLMLLSFAVLMSLWGFWNEQSRASVMDATLRENELVLTPAEAAFNSAWRNGQYAVANWSGHGRPGPIPCSCF